MQRYGRHSNGAEAFREFSSNDGIMLPCAKQQDVIVRVPNTVAKKRRHKNEEYRTKDTLNPHANLTLGTYTQERRKVLGTIPILWFSLTLDPKSNRQDNLLYCISRLQKVIEYTPIFDARLLHKYLGRS